jgi:hypothetical protein
VFGGSGNARARDKGFAHFPRPDHDLLAHVVAG